MELEGTPEWAWSLFKQTPRHVSADSVFPAGADGVKALYYEGLPYKGKQTYIFSFYNSAP